MQQPQEQQQRREQQRKVITPPTANKNRPKSSFLSWILNSSTEKNASPPPSSTLTAIIPDEIYNNRSNSIENSRLSNNNQYINTKLQLPDDVDETKSYANTEYAYKRNANSVTKRESTTIIPCSKATAVASYQQIQIPDRRQSHLYTPFHDTEGEEEEEEEETTTLFDYKHRSYYTSQLSPTINVIDVTSSNSTTLTRSATWQPSSSSSQLPPSSQLLSTLPPSSLSPPPVPRHNCLASPTGAAENMIPARRTSRNYSEDPEIQAKLNAVLNSEKATYLSQVIQNSNLSNTNMYRRSTTPKSRK